MYHLTVATLPLFFEIAPEKSPAIGEVDTAVEPYICNKLEVLEVLAPNKTE